MLTVAIHIYLISLCYCYFFLVTLYISPDWSWRDFSQSAESQQR